mmetsp:Transcript_34962/g.62929  ORF Transcript_34962/g.62929 Transcript_34962/m.62929 type:complete len:218 (-) Transcript_34962:670-1323(-)
MSFVFNGDCHVRVRFVKQTSVVQVLGPDYYNLKIMQFRISHQLGEPTKHKRVHNELLVCNFAGTLQNANLLACILPSLTYSDSGGSTDGTVTWRLLYNLRCTAHILGLVLKHFWCVHPCAIYYADRHLWTCYFSIHFLNAFPQRWTHLTVLLASIQVIKERCHVLKSVLLLWGVCKDKVVRPWLDATNRNGHFSKHAGPRCAQCSKRICCSLGYVFW